jgi:hypothetical protein
MQLKAALPHTFLRFKSCLALHEMAAPAATISQFSQFFGDLQLSSSNPADTIAEKVHRHFLIITIRST